MKDKIKNIITLSIFSIIIILLIILCSIGYSFKYVTKVDNKEHFFQKIKEWVVGKEPKPFNPNNIKEEPVFGVQNKQPSIEFDNIKPVKINEPKLDEPPLSLIYKNVDNISVPINKNIKHNIIKKDSANTILNNQKEILKTKSNNTIPNINSSIQKKGPLQLNNNNNDIIKNIKFQFFDSNESPDKKDYIYTGAEIGLNGNNNLNITCGNSQNSSIAAEAIAIIDQDGTISDIKMINHGKGYKLPPKVQIIGGGGNGCKAKAIVDDHTTIVHIEILDNGHGYISTPTVIINKPNENKKCKLFIKNI